MDFKVNLKLSMTEVITTKILNAINKEDQLTRTQYLKCKLGIETLLINVTKLCVMYLLAMIVKIPMEVFIFHMGFLTVRTFAYGAHSNSSMICTILSCFILVGLPAFLVHYYVFNKVVLCIIGGFNIFIINKYAPGATAKNPMRNTQKKQRLRNKALIANAILILVMFISPSLLFSNLVIIGALMATTLLLPEVYKCLER
jgi:accessory gene regulator B